MKSFFRIRKINARLRSIVARDPSISSIANSAIQRAGNADSDKLTEKTKPLNSIERVIADHADTEFSESNFQGVAPKTSPSQSRLRRNAASVAQEEIQVVNPWQSIADHVITQQANTKSFTLGVMTLGDCESSSFTIYRLMRSILGHTRQNSILVSTHVSLEKLRTKIQSGYEVHEPTSEFTFDPRIRLESWRSHGARANTFAMLQSALNDLPGIKRKFRFVVLDLGSLDKPWTESIGRMCDSSLVFVSNPSAGQHRQACRRAAQLEGIGVHVMGSVSLNAAA